MIPVGNTGIQPDPLGSISKMIGLRSALLGIQQQQQNLQTGAYQQQSAQAGAQQDQQKNAEYQAAQNIAMKGAQSGQYTNADGTLNRQKMADDISKVAPTYGQAIAGQLLSQANEIISNKQALFNLTSDKRSKIGDTIGALASDPTVDHSKVTDAFEALRQQYPNDTELSRMLQSAGGAIPPSAYGAQLQQTLNSMAAAAKGTPGVQPATNAASQNLTRGTFSGQLNMPGGNAPNPTGPAVAAQQTTQTGAAGGDNERFNQISQDNQKGQSMLALSQQVANLSDQVRTGKLSKEWSDRLAVLNQDSPGITARQMLGKYAAQLKAMAESGASTDAERSTVEAGMPNPDSMDPAATKEAAQYVGGMGALRNARDQVASQYIQKNGSTAGLRAVDDAFMQHADPFVYTYKSLPAGPERQQFLLKKFGDGSKITNPGALQQFLDQQNVVKHYGG